MPGNKSLLEIGKEKRYKCQQCEKTFKKEDYRLKHMRLRHSPFECGVCNQTVKEGNRALHMIKCSEDKKMRCSEDKKTVTCNFCKLHMEFEIILHHLKTEHGAWEYRQAQPVADKMHLKIQNGRVEEAGPAAAPPPSPEIPPEITKLVEELKKIEEGTEQVIENRAEQNTVQPMAEDLNTINPEDLVKFDDFDFNLLL